MATKEEWFNATMAALLCTAGLSLAVLGIGVAERRPLPQAAVLPTVTPKPAPTAAPAIVPCGCNYDAYSCEDFRDAGGNVSQEGAQTCFNHCMDTVGTDVHNLVTDDPNDPYVWSGWACVEKER